jgi:hypothetical protein
MVEKKIQEHTSATQPKICAINNQTGTLTSYPTMSLLQSIRRTVTKWTSPIRKKLKTFRGAPDIVHTNIQTEVEVEVSVIPSISRGDMEGKQLHVVRGGEVSRYYP